MTEGQSGTEYLQIGKLVWDPIVQEAMENVSAVISIPSTMGFLLAGISGSNCGQTLEGRKYRYLCAMFGVIAQGLFPVPSENTGRLGEDVCHTSKGKKWSGLKHREVVEESSRLENLGNYLSR